MTRIRRCGHPYGCCLCAVGIACMNHWGEGPSRDRIIAENCCYCCQGADVSTWRELTAEEREAGFAQVAEERARIDAMFAPGRLDGLLEVAE